MEVVGYGYRNSSTANGTLLAGLQTGDVIIGFGAATNWQSRVLSTVAGSTAAWSTVSTGQYGGGGGSAWSGDGGWVIGYTRVTADGDVRCTVNYGDAQFIVLRGDELPASGTPWDRQLTMLSTAPATNPRTTGAVAVTAGETLLGLFGCPPTSKASRFTRTGGQGEVFAYGSRSQAALLAPVEETGTKELSGTYLQESGGNPDYGMLVVPVVFAA